MENQNKPVNANSNGAASMNVNTNVNNNTQHIYIDGKILGGETQKKTNSLTKKIAGAIITIAVALCIYLGKQVIDANSKAATQQNQQQIIGTKLTK